MNIKIMKISEITLLKFIYKIFKNITLGKINSKNKINNNKIYNNKMIY